MIVSYDHSLPLHSLMVNDSKWNADTQTALWQTDWQWLVFRLHRHNRLTCTYRLLSDRQIMAAFSGGNSRMIPASCSGSPSLCVLQPNLNILSDCRPAQSRMPLMLLMHIYRFDLLLSRIWWLAKRAERLPHSCCRGQHTDTNTV